MCHGRGVSGGSPIGARGARRIGPSGADSRVGGRPPALCLLVLLGGIGGIGGIDRRWIGVKFVQERGELSIGEGMLGHFVPVGAGLQEIHAFLGIERARGDELHFVALDEDEAFGALVIDAEEALLGRDLDGIADVQAESGDAHAGADGGTEAKDESQQEEGGAEDEHDDSGDLGIGIVLPASNLNGEDVGILQGGCGGGFVGAALWHGLWCGGVIFRVGGVIFRGGIGKFFIGAWNAVHNGVCGEYGGIWWGDVEGL